jgi:two-component system phosphate regulon sensor histidine kinase PhoR
MPLEYTFQEPAWETTRPLRRAWRWLTEPAPTVQGIENRHQARLLSSLLILLLPLSMLSILTRAIVSPAYRLPLLPLSTILVITIVYGLSRTKYYRLGAALIITALPLFLLFLIIGADFNPVYFNDLLPFLVLGVLLSSTLFGLRGTALVAAASIGVVLLTAAFVSEVNFSALLWLLTLLVLCSVVTGVSILSRDALENTRQAVVLDSEVRYQSLFDDSPIALWEGDFSRAMQRIDKLRAAGVSDFEAYFKEHPEIIKECIGMIRIVNANQATLKLFNVRSREDLSQIIRVDVGANPTEFFLPEIVALAEGQTRFEAETTIKTRQGDTHRVIVRRTVAPGYEDTWAKVFIALLDITEQKRAENALRESEAKYRALVEQSLQSVAIVQDNPLRFSFVNKAMQETTGYSYEEMIGFTPDQARGLVHPADRQAVDTRVAKRFAGEEAPARAAHRIITKSGDVRWMETFNSMIEYNGEPAMITGFVDITERKQAEEALRKSEEKFRVLLEHLPVGVSLLDQDRKMLYANPALGKILDMSRDDLLQGKHQDRRHIRPDGTPMPPEEWPSVQAAREMKVRKDVEIGVITENGKAIWTNVSAAPFPTTDKGVVIVTADITTRKQAQEAEREQRTLAEALANAAAVVNSSLDLRQVLGRILDNVGHVVPHDAAEIWLLEGDVARVVGNRGYAERGSEEALLALRLSVENTRNLRLAKETGQPVLIDDAHDLNGWVESETTEWVRSVVTVPICVDDKILGFLNLLRATAGFYTVGHAERLQAFGNQVAIAIRNAQLFEAEREQRAFAESLADTAAALNSTLDLDEVLKHILDNIGRVAPHDAVNILLVENDFARIVRGRNYVDPELTEEVAQAISLPIDDTRNLREMIQSGQPIAIPDTRAYSGWITFPKTRWVRSYAGAPVRLAGQTIGFVEVDSATPDFYTPAHAERLQALADHAATAIQNARLFEQAQRHLESLSNLNLASQVITSSLDLQEVLKQIVELAGSVVRSDYTSVILPDEKGEAVVGVEDFRGVAPITQRIRSGGTTHHVMESGQPLVVDDIAEDGTTNPPLRRPDGKLIKANPSLVAVGVRSFAAVPIQGREGAPGVLYVRSREPCAFHSQLPLLTTFANQAAVAVENARLYQRLEELARGLEKTVLERTAELRQTKERVETILNYSPDPILLLKPNGEIDTANPAFQRIFGYQADELYRQSPFSLVFPNDADAMQDVLKRTIERHEVERLVLIAQSKDGATFDAEAAMAPIIEKNGDLLGVVCNLRDISAQKEVQRMKDAFVSNVSHELRTPITSIKLNLTLLRMNPQGQEVYIDRMERETSRLADLIEDLLRLSRLDQERVALDLKTVNLNALAARYVEDRIPVAEIRHLDLRLGDQPHLPPVQADDGLLGQALSVLITNALHYTPAGGEVVISTQARQEEGEWWVGVRVSDSGPGISAEDMPHLFKRFYRGKVGRQSEQPGTGLGLAIAREIVERHGGRIEVESAGVSGQGATFSIWLPVSGAEIGDTAE